MSAKIKVAIRLRPLIQIEINSGHISTKLKVRKESNEIVTKLSDTAVRGYKFDKVFGSDSTQEAIFRELEIHSYIKKFIEGYHSTIFAYGQTGSGKTFTMEHYDYALNEKTSKPKANLGSSNEGIIHKGVYELFRQLGEYKKIQTDSEYRIFVSFIQIYNEKIFDLLNMKNSSDITAPLRMRWTKEDQFTVDGLFMGECNTPEEVISLFNEGVKNRFIATHKMNIASSRSHTIFCCTLQISKRNLPNNASYSKLQFVDLAGSERSAVLDTSSSTSSIRTKESIDINKSLSVLRRVIIGLADKKNKKYIPYRESKLTSLLKNSFGGNAYCLMIACLSPSDAYLEENISTLNYASRAAEIMNEPIKNEDPAQKIIDEQKRIIKELHNELQSANDHILWITNLLQKKLKETGDKTQIPEYKIISTNSFSKHKAKSKSPIPQKGTLPEKEKSPNLNKDIEDKHINNKLIESLTMIKELLSSNKQLRDLIDSKDDEYARSQGEIEALLDENQDLREKIDILNTLIINENNLNLNKGQVDFFNKINEPTPLKHKIQKENKESNESNFKDRFTEKKPELIVENETEIALNKIPEKVLEIPDTKAQMSDSKLKISKQIINEDTKKIKKNEKNEKREKASKPVNVSINHIPVNALHPDEERNDYASAIKFNNNRMQDLRNYDNFDDNPSSPDMAHRQAIQNAQNLNLSKEKNPSIFEKQIKSKEDAQKALSELLSLRLGNNHN